ncbi:hypothetical protein FSPOR_6460 [Fusarium sporotrichioides]|uniref:Proteoglycan n=1 Tax=Fusarium sporotrichioides TaxID=5514 RepID=A0A395S2V1_FUSSP|nr:hypothetical protein FSPOR_6460 [Fusarium sporotrichioides]
MKLTKRLGAFFALNLSLAPSVQAAATCSQLSGSIYTGPNGNAFDIACDTSTVNGNIFAYYSDGDEFQDCVDRCDAVPACIVSLYLAGSGDCALINSYQGTRSFTGNDIAIKRPATSTTTTSAEPTSSVTSSTEVSSTEDSSTETSSIEATTTVASSTETSSIETSSIEATSTVALSTEPSSIEASSTETTSATASAATTSTALSFSTSSIEAESTSLEASPESLSTSQAFTLVTTTADFPSTSTVSTETSTDDCDDETSTIETSIVVVTSTATGSEIQPTSLSTDIMSSPDTVIQTSEVSTLATSEASASTSSAFSLTTVETQNSVSTSLPSSVTSDALASPTASSDTTVTETRTTYTQVASPSLSSAGTTEHGSKTLSVSGITTMKTESASRLATPYPASDCVWTVYLTMVEYVTCSTGVVPETATTTTYITAGSHDGSYKPPVVTLPSGCIGGYQVDASGHSYPLAQPTNGSYENSPDRGYGQPYIQPTPGSSGSSHPGYNNAKPHVPAPTAESHGDSEPEYINSQPSVPQSTQGSHANSADDNYSQPSIPGHGSPEPNKNEPQPTGSDAATTAVSAYGPGAPENSVASSGIHHEQVGISTTLAIRTTATEERYAPSASASAPEEAPSTPVIASGASRHQGMAWTLIAVALIALRV